MRTGFEAHQPDIVMHLAAESHVDRTIDGPRDFIDTNITGTFVLIEKSVAVIATRGCAMAHLVTEERVAGKGGCASTTHVYPDGVLLRLEPAAGRVVFVHEEEYRFARLAAALQTRPPSGHAATPRDTVLAPTPIAETEIRMPAAPSAIAAADRLPGPDSGRQAGHPRHRPLCRHHPFESRQPDG